MTGDAAPISDELALRELPRLDVRDDDDLIAFSLAHGLPSLNERSAPDYLIPVAHLSLAFFGLRLVALDLVGEPAWSDAGAYPIKWKRHRSAESALYRESQFHLHLEPPLRERSVSLIPQPASLTCALALQLYNVIVEHAPIHRCGNERCRRYFQRQSGRTRKGTTRSTGVLYCSRSCARNQADRERRRRLNAEKEGRRDGND